MSGVVESAEELRRFRPYSSYSEPDFWNGEIVWVTPDDLGDLVTPVLSNSSRHITDEGHRNCGTTIVPAGSLVLSTRAPIGHLAIAGVELCTNQGCRSLVFRSTSDGRYSYYQLHAARPELESWGQGSTFKELSRSKLEALPLVDPPPDEQRAIAEFLDRETGKIDALVAKKERLIELLQEKRTALITHAVTKGLDPTAPTKPSGIDWLGDIPAHWEVKPLKRCIDPGTSISYGIVQPGPHVEDGVPFVQTTNISGTGDFALDRLQRTTFEIESAYPRSRIKPGDILLGIRASIGAAHIVPDHLDGANLSRGVARIVPGSMLRSKFLVHYLWSQAVFEFWGLGSQGTTFSDVPIGTVRELPVPIPPLSEQATVVEKLELQLDGIDRLLDRIRDAVARLHEFRTALISAAVTGKIDVREEVA